MAESILDSRQAGTLQHLRELLAAVPFVPFTVRLTDGQQITLEDPSVVYGYDGRDPFFFLEGGPEVYLADIAAIEPAADDLISKRGD